MPGTVEIDISQVPEDKRNHPDFIELRQQIAAALDSQAWRSAFSVHEAGHWIYFERAGVTRFLVEGPRIIYTPVQDEFSGFPASVQPQAMSPKSEMAYEELLAWFFDLTKGYVAGGVFAGILTTAPDVGNQQDRENYEAQCDGLQAKGITVDRNGIWNEAELAVRTELRNPAFKRQAWAKAAELREQLFGSR